MDRIYFSKSINVDPVLQVEKFFNEVMAMYNLVEGVNYKCIHGLVHGENKISFVVTFDTAEEASITNSSLNGSIIQIYNNNFQILGSNNDNELSLQLAKV